MSPTPFKRGVTKYNGTIFAILTMTEFKTLIPL